MKHSVKLEQDGILVIYDYVVIKDKPLGGLLSFHSNKPFLGAMLNRYCNHINRSCYYDCRSVDYKTTDIDVIQRHLEVEIKELKTIVQGE